MYPIPLHSFILLGDSGSFLFLVYFPIGMNDDIVFNSCSMYMYKASNVKTSAFLVMLGSLIVENSHHFPNNVNW